MYKIENLADSGGSYSLKVNAGERIYEFTCQYQTERSKWVEALKLASKTARELSKAKIKGTRNIAPLLEQFTTDKIILEKSLREKCENILPKDKKWNNAGEILEASLKIRTEFISVNFFISE